MSKNYSSMRPTGTWGACGVVVSYLSVVRHGERRWWVVVVIWVGEGRW